MKIALHWKKYTRVKNVVYGCISGQSDVAYLINGGRYRNYETIDMGTIGEGLK